MPWEQEKTPEQYSTNLALPCDIEVQASNGASDYGNKYGEPVVTGFTRSFGQRLPNGQRVEWIKPIMFTAGVGMLDSRHSTKGSPEPGYIVCKVGGPAYRIGLGGGAASSRSQGTVDSSLDFNAVQRGDAEMENRMNRFIRACVELGSNNPIISIHDQVCIFIILILLLIITLFLSYRVLVVMEMYLKKLLIQWELNMI